MSDVFQQAKQRIGRDWIEHTFYHPEARWENGNYKTLNPLRHDTSVGSFSIREDGVYFDHAGTTGPERSGDIITLYAHSKGLTPMEAACEILGISEAPPVQRAETAPEPIKLSWLPIPEGKVPQFRNKPDYLTLYHVKGKPAFYIVRYNASESLEKKIIYPLYWTGGAFEKGFPENLKKCRPLYQFDKTKTVVIVEGEGKREEGERAYPQYAWTCWHGGAQNVNKVDLSGCAGCDLIIWGDADEPGNTAGDYLCQQLTGQAARLRRVVPPVDKPKGWDVADALQDNTDVLSLLEGAVSIEQSDFRVDEDTLVEPRACCTRPLTDLGNAERFVDMWGHILRYNIDKGRWMIWWQGKWNDHDQTIITPMVKRTIRSMALADESKATLFWAAKSEAAKAIASMMSLATKERGIPAREDDLDQKPFYINVPNGVVDLRTGELLEAKPEWLMTKTANVNFNPEATCPLFLRFLDQTFEEDPGLLNFIQRWIGYSLTADTSAQTFAVFYGIGANGKSTLVETIQRIAGDYVRTAPPDTFIQKQSGGIPNDIAALRGSRMVLATETEANAKLAEAKVKGMTGGDRVSARYMRGEFFDFTPTWKITISTNHRPRISGGDYGIWRRVVLVPFNNVVTPDKQDPKLPIKLMAEAEGILAWAVKGAMMWHSGGGGRAGLQVPQRVYEETQEYREDEDVIGRFTSCGCLSPSEITEQLRTGKLAKGGTQASHLFYSFRYWCTKEGEEGYAKTTNQAFGRYMRERGFLTEANSAGRWYPNVVPKPEFYMIRDGFKANQDD